MADMTDPTIILCPDCAEMAEALRRQTARIAELEAAARALYGTVPTRPTWLKKWPVINERVKTVLGEVSMAEMRTRGEHCDYYGCDKPLAPDQPETGMRFCAEHDAEFAQLAREGKPGPILRFWVKAQGGAERAAKRTLGGAHG